MRDLLWRVCRMADSAHRAAVRMPASTSATSRRTTRGSARRARRRASALWLIRESRVAGSRVSRRTQAAAAHAGATISATPGGASPPARPRALLCAALLSLGIGLATAMFSVVDALLLQPAPFRECRSPRAAGPVPARARCHGRLARRAGSSTRSRPDASRFSSTTTAAPGRARSSRRARSTMLGVRPLRGRGLFDQDARPGADGVVVVSETIWRSVFGGDPSLIGRRITSERRDRDRRRHHAGHVSVFPRRRRVVWGPFDPARAAPSPATIFGAWRRACRCADAAARAAAIARQTRLHPAATTAATPPLPPHRRDRPRRLHAQRHLAALRRRRARVRGGVLECRQPPARASRLAAPGVRHVRGAGRVARAADAPGARGTRARRRGRAGRGRRTRLDASRRASPSSSWAGRSILIDLDVRALADRVGPGRGIGAPVGPRARLAGHAQRPGPRAASVVFDGHREPGRARDDEKPARRPDRARRVAARRIGAPDAVILQPRARRSRVERSTASSGSA